MEFIKFIFKCIGSVFLVCLFPFTVFWGLTIPMGIYSWTSAESPWWLIGFGGCWLLSLIWCLYSEEKSRAVQRF